MRHHRLLSGILAVIVGMIGLMGLLAALSLPVAAQSGAEGDGPTAGNLPLTAPAPDSVRSPINLPPPHAAAPFLVPNKQDVVGPIPPHTAVSVSKSTVGYTNTIEIGPTDVYPDDNTDTTVAANAEVDRAEMWVANGGANMWGHAQPNAPITLTTVLTQYTGMANGVGDWNIDNIEALEPGATITVTAGDGLLPLVITIPSPFTVYASSITNTVWGRIDTLNHVQISVDLYGYGSLNAWTDSGNYSVIWSDVPRGGEGHVRYESTQDNAQVVMHRRFQTPDLILTVNSSHDWVETNYEADHTIWITITDSGGAVKATMVDSTTVVPWWGGRTGFSTNMGTWSPNQPDIVPGDWAYGALDNGYTSSVRVGAITGNLDLVGDSISGTVTAAWFSQMLNAQCSIDNVNNSNQDFTVNPAGGAYACDFTTAGDLVPGQNVSVQYQEPDGDWVRAVFRWPTPHVKIQKQGNGSPGEGGNFAFRINYENNGDGDAENTVITDTLLYGMTYLTDTTGLPHTGSGAPGDPLVWQMGTLTNSTSGWFDLFVQITATVDNRVTNTVQIATSNPYDEYRDWEYNNGWGKMSEWWSMVQANNTHLNVGKWAWTGDPAAGYDVVFTVQPCNNGSTASSQVTIADSLHPSLTLQSWWGQYPGWTEVSSDAHTLQVSNPAIPANQCSQVYVRAHVDNSAWQGMPISNTAVITASNDLEDNDNETTWWGNINEPHVNLNVNTNWNWGQLTPGGQIRYNINFNNSGNVPVASTVRITDILPVSTTFNSWNYGGGLPLTLVTATANYVVWELPGLDNGYGDGFEIILDVDAGALPGTVLTNTAAISPQPIEDNYDDNLSTAVETLFGHGPNLRVTKWGDWYHDRAGHAWYQFAVENVGDVTVPWVVVTDTYPLSMTMEGDTSTDWSRVASYYHDPAGHWFTATLENVHPGYRLDFSFNTTMATPVPFGLILTNTVAVPHVAGDTHAADDVDHFTLATGPDLYVEKTLVGGTPLPGEIITFSLHYGNAQPGHTWWWNTQGNVYITDTLPAGLEYITSTLRWCGGPDCPYIVPTITGNQLVFEVGAQNASWWNEVYLTVRVTDTARGGDLFTNQVDIASNLPAIDIEPYYANNHDAYTVLIDLPVFEISKAYTSNRVAGTAVAYALRITNTGTHTGTNLVVIDHVPANVTYSNSNGTFGGGIVTWTLPSLAPNGTASLWFSGTLDCAAGQSVNNTQYHVASSAEGVTSGNGLPVGFVCLAPSLNANFTQSASAIIMGGSVAFTDTSTTNGPSLVGWLWTFGDGGFSSAQHPTHLYTTVGVYNVTLLITDSLGYTATHFVPNAVNVTSGCLPLTSADFTYAPLKPLIHNAVTFTATSTPVSATQPIMYAWNFGDGSTTSQSTPTVSHAYQITGTRTVTLTVSNACTIPGLTTSHAITIQPYRTYLPLIVRNH